MKRYKTLRMAVALAAVAVLSFGLWLKMPYSFAPQRQVAEAFIQCVSEGNFEAAFALTLKNGYTGNTFEEFKDKARREIGGSGYRFAYAHPPQSNGNRLRRRLRGAAVDMPEVSLEFRGPSLLRITLRPEVHNQWKIFYITSHAG